MNIPVTYEHMARSLDQCIEMLKAENKPTFPKYEQDGRLWCNATWDGFLCWQAIPANTSFTLPCPPIRGLLQHRVAVRHCHSSGRWLGRDPNNFSKPAGWTNYSGCWQPQISKMMKKLDQQALSDAKHIAANARKLEFVGLTLSLTSLIIAVTIFAIFKRLRVFRNQIHRQLMTVMLCNVVVRLILYIDQSVGRDLNTWVPQSEAKATIHSMIIVCELFYIILEYLKTVAFAFMFIEGYYLHNTAVVHVFQETEPSLWKYAALGWVIPAIHVLIWVVVVLAIRSFKFDVCLGDYYLQPEYWIMNSVRMAELVKFFHFVMKTISANFSFLYRIICALCATRKSVKAALMLIPLLGIPNIMQTIPFVPTKDNLPYFAAFTYIASFFYMYQGFVVAVLYCFTNREVINVLKSHWSRYRLQHTSADTLRRGSRAASVFYQAVVTSVPKEPKNVTRDSISGRCDSVPERTSFSIQVVEGDTSTTTLKLSLQSFSRDEVSSKFLNPKCNGQPPSGPVEECHNSDISCGKRSIQHCHTVQQNNDDQNEISMDQMIRLQELKPLCREDENGLPAALAQSGSNKKSANQAVGFLSCTSLLESLD